MCQQITVLARLDDRRWLSSCEHQIVHFNWDNVSVRLPLTQMRALGKALRECAQVAQRFRIAGTDEVCIIFDQHDLYQVWFGGVGLCLAPTDFQHFCQLIRTACAHPTTATSDELHPSTHHSVESPIRTTYHLFSHN